MTEAMIEAGGETFTDRCRRMLTEQPNQHEFTLSRVGLETLVLDSERLGERNRKDAEEHLLWKRSYPDPIPLEAQIERLRSKYPKAAIGEENANGNRLLTIPGVKLPKGWRPRTTTFYVVIPQGFPGVQPNWFYTPRDVRLDHGGCPQNTAFGGRFDGDLTGDLLWWHWSISAPNYRHSLVQYVNAMRRRFEVRL